MAQCSLSLTTRCYILVPSNELIDYFDKVPEYAFLRKVITVSQPIDQLENEDNIDWKKLIYLSDSHGLSSLLYQYLINNRITAPGKYFNELKHRYEANALRNKLLTHELVKIMDFLKQNSIRVLAYKGPTLTIALYGDLKLRHFGDLDILIHQKDALNASALISDLNYVRTIPPMSPAKESRFLKIDHEHEFVSDDDLISIDLHWALSTHRFPFQMNTEALFTNYRTIQYGQASIDYIADEYLLVFLCMHCNKDLWRKLIWIADIDRLIRSHNELDWDLSFRIARESHCERMLIVTLYVLHTLLDTPLPTDIISRIHQDKHVQTLGLDAVKKSRRIQPYSFLKCLTIDSYILSVCDSAYDKVQYIFRSLVTPSESDLLAINLPRWLHFIYYIFKPTKLITLCLARSLKRLIFNSSQN